MGPVMRDVGVELGLPPDRDQVSLPVLQDRFRLLRFEDDADRHRRDAHLLADTFGVGHLEAEATRDLRRRRRAGNAAGGTVDHIDAAGFNSRAKTVSSMFNRPGPSTAETRTNNGMPSGTAPHRFDDIER